MSGTDLPNGDRKSDEEFLARWSRRKQEVLEQPAQLDLAAGEKAEQQPPALTDEDMPPLETLHQDSDFSGFMSPQVSEGLRKLALRKMFQVAGFNVRDGLDDYDDDFTSFAKLGDLITSDMRFQMEQKARDETEASELDDEQQAVADQSADAEVEPEQPLAEAEPGEPGSSSGEEDERIAVVRSESGRHETEI